MCYCDKGHKLDKENILYDRGKVRCRECMRIRSRDYRKNKTERKAKEKKTFTIEEIQKLRDKKMSWEDIGVLYGYSGSGIKRYLKRFGVVVSSNIKEHHLQIVSRKCVICGERFNVDKSQRKLCDKCRSDEKQKERRHKYYKKAYEKIRIEREEVHCLECGKLFLPRNCINIFCCINCKETYHSKKYMDYKKDLQEVLGVTKHLDKNIGYVRVYCPKHPKANTRGFVYEHRLVAEQMLGRFLSDDEVVHHKNGVRHDNRRENLEVMNKVEHGKLGGQRKEDLLV